MLVLIIPDVHLKPMMFDRAEEILTEYHVDRVVCLMDIADDWGQQANLAFYVETYNRAIQFAKAHPDSLWCYGNHDISYIWQKNETGYSSIARETVVERLKTLQECLSDKKQVTYIHRIDNVLFCHGGISNDFVHTHMEYVDELSVKETLDAINHFGRKQMWTGNSPIWLRPQYEREPLWHGSDFLQVVGHTPMKQITRERNLLSCDVFSTDFRRGRLGPWEYPLLDTETWEWKGIPFDVQ